eukprot:110840_1
MAIALTITGIFFSSASFMLGLCLLYYVRLFYQYRDEMIVIKRRGNIVIVYNVCVIVILLCGYPLSIILYWGWDLIPKDSTLFLVADICNDLVFAPWWYLAVLLMLFRYWLIYYDIQFSNCCLNLEWKQCIHHDLNTLKQEKWYINHRSTIGNTLFMLKRIVIFSSIITILTITTSYMYSFKYTSLQLWLFINGIVMVFVVISMLIIWNKMPSFNDNIYLYKE